MPHLDLERKNNENATLSPSFIIFFFTIWTLLSCVCLYFTTRHHKMTCSYKSNFCEIQTFDIKKFKYQLTHKIPLSEVKEMYLKEFKSTDTDHSTSYKLVLKTTTKDIELESASSNFWISSKRDEIQKMKAFLNHNFSKNFVYNYQESFSVLIFATAFCLFGIRMILSTFTKFKKHKQENFAIVKQ